MITYVLLITQIFSCKINLRSFEAECCGSLNQSFGEHKFNNGISCEISSRQESITRQKLKGLKKELMTCQNTTRFQLKDLIKIVVPEYISFNNLEDEFEKYLVTFLYSMKSDLFKKVSVGPFQMQPEFMMRYSNVNDYEGIILNLDSLASLKTEFKILQNFVNHNKTLTIKEIINLYNSGNKNKELVFRKINLQKTYYDYANELIKNYY